MSWNHGTTTGYSRHRCRCDACMTAWRDYQRRYCREWYHGERRTVATKEAQRKIASLCSRGWTRKAIAAAGGLDYQTVYKIADGTVARVRKSTVEKILAVGVNERPDGVMSPASDAVRLIDGMRAAGIPAAVISKDLRVSAPARIKKQTHVRSATRKRLVVAYQYLARQGAVPADLLEEVGAL